MPKDIDYELVYQDAENPAGFENPELIGKKFKIQFHSKNSDGGMEGAEIDFFIIDEIEMINQ